MKRFLLKIALFLVLFFLLDKCFLFVRDISPKLGADKKLELLLEGKINKDLIVFGSSRAREGIATWMIKDSLNVDCYNLAHGGSEIEFQYFLLKVLLKNNKAPKYIIKVIDENFELTPSDQNKFLIDKLYLLLKYDEVRGEMIKQKKKNEIIASLSVLYLMNKSNFMFTKYNKSNNRVLNDTLVRYGALAKPFKIKKRDWLYEEADYRMENEELSRVKNFINFQKLCQANNIQLIYVIPPSYTKLNQDFIKRIKGLVNNNSKLHIYDQKEKAYLNKNLYNDKVHLNKSGSVIFTNELIRVIKEQNEILMKNKKIEKPTTR